MGCCQSMPTRQQHDSPAVALCRHRSALLAEAHRAYAHSLQAAGAALQDFLRAVQQDASAPPHQQPQPLPDHEPAAGLVQLSGQRNEEHDAERGDDDDDGGRVHFPSGDDDDGVRHTQFPPDDEEKEDDDISGSSSPQEMASPSPPPQMPPPYGYGYGYAPPYSSGPGPSYAYGGGYYGAEIGHGSFVDTNSQPPSVSYQHFPQVTNATLHHYQNDGAAGPTSSYSYYGGNPDPYQNDGAAGPTSSYSYYGGNPDAYQQYPQQGDDFSTVPAPSYSYPEPSPPTWDSISQFEEFEGGYHYHCYYPYPVPEQPAAMANHTPSWTSSEDPGDDEDIPELEEDDGLEEVIGPCTVVNNGNVAEEEERRTTSAGEELDRRPDAGTSVFIEEECKSSLDAGSSSNISDEIVVEKEHAEDSAIADLPTEPVNMIKVVEEITMQFDRASKSAAELCKVLEVGKVPYNHNNSSRLKVLSSMMICGFPSMGKKKFLQYDAEQVMGCGNLSSTLQKLYMWEKKLLHQVKTQEKISTMYDQKCNELKFLYNRSDDVHKLETCQIYIRKLVTEISVAIKLVNSISKNINTLRDEELCPQTDEIIQGFMEMWRTMSECHQIQCHALSQAEDIDSMIDATRFSKAHRYLARQLELQLFNMTASFAVWFSAQKNYANTMNEWLKKGIQYGPEAKDDDVPHFLPGHLGASPLFTICNNWTTSMARISEVEVVGTMQAFASKILGICERHMSEDGTDA